MASKNYRHTGKVALGIETTTNELERFEFENGALRVTGGGGGGAVTVDNDETNPVPTDETLFANFTVSRYTVDTSGAGTQTGDTAWQGADDIESRGFMLLAPLENTGTIYIGDSASTCFIPLSPGSRTSYPLPNLTQIYAYATDNNDADQFLVVERYF